MNRDNDDEIMKWRQKILSANENSLEKNNLKIRRS